MTRGAGTHPIDVHVGQRLRLRRKRLEISQSYLADGIGVTFQQIQKYELGTNRISASTLYEMAAFLEVPVSFFFEGIDAARDARMKERDAFARTLAQRMLLEPEGKALAEAFLNFRRPQVRGRFVELAREIAETDAESAPDGRANDNRSAKSAASPPG